MADRGPEKNEGAADTVFENGSKDSSEWLCFPLFGQEGNFLYANVVKKGGCAIKNKVDHCSRCDQFPCEIHYEQEVYSKKLLDMIKEMLEKA